MFLFLLMLTELMPDPVGSDLAPLPAGEWIELYLDQPQNLSGWYFTDSNPTHRLYLATTNTVVGDDPNYLVAYRNGDTDFALNNGYDEVFLYSPNGTLYDHVSYHRTSTGLSWSRHHSLWNLTLPTPGTSNMNTSATCDVQVALLPPQNTTPITGKLTMLYGNNITVTLHRRVSNAYNITLQDYATKKVSFSKSNTQKFKPRLATGQFVRAQFWITNTTCNDDATNDYAETIFWIPPEQQQESLYVPKKTMKPNETFIIRWQLPLEQLYYSNHSLSFLTPNATISSYSFSTDNKGTALFSLPITIPPCEALEHDTLLVTTHASKITDERLVKVNTESCAHYTTDIRRAISLTWINTSPHQTHHTIQLHNNYAETIPLELRSFAVHNLKTHSLDTKTLPIYPGEKKEITFTSTSNVTGTSQLKVEAVWQGRITPLILTTSFTQPAPKQHVQEHIQLPLPSYVSREIRLIQWLPLILVLIIALWLPQQKHI